MNKKFACLLLSFGILTSILCGTTTVNAGSTAGTVYLWRGGSSEWVASDYKDSTGKWSAYVDDCDFEGIPYAIFGTNYVVTRPYTPSYKGIHDKTSDTLTFSCLDHYQSKSYWTNYTSGGATYILKASLSSSSANWAGYVAIDFVA